MKLLDGVAKAQGQSQPPKQAGLRASTSTTMAPTTAQAVLQALVGAHCIVQPCVTSEINSAALCDVLVQRRSRGCSHFGFSKSHVGRPWPLSARSGRRVSVAPACSICYAHGAALVLACVAAHHTWLTPPININRCMHSCLTRMASASGRAPTPTHRDKG